jgi:hypothetical protein
LEFAMAVKEQPKQYESHGKTFDTRKEAESAVTADGVPFEFGVFHDYYHVEKPWGSLPYVRSFCYLAGAWSVRDSDKPDVVEIAEDRDGKRHYVPITELYADKGKAVAALMVAQGEWLEERRREIEELAAKVAKGERVL